MNEETSIANQAPAASEDNTTANANPEALKPEADQVTEDGSEPAQVKAEPEAKPEKTPEQRELDKLRRRIDKVTRDKYDLKARLDSLQPPENRDSVGTVASDSEPLSLTREQWQEVMKAEAEHERRASVVKSLEDSLGKEKFDEVSSELADAFDGLVDSRGVPKPIVDALFEADDPVKLAAFLADPDNLDESERLAKCSPVQLGREVAKLEMKLAAQSAKPKPSKAPAPLEPLRGQGNINSVPDPIKYEKEYRKWANEQERKAS
jgi:hypothetical protein